MKKLHEGLWRLTDREERLLAESLEVFREFIQSTKNSKDFSEHRRAATAFVAARKRKGTGVRSTVTSHTPISVSTSPYSSVRKRSE